MLSFSLHQNKTIIHENMGFYDRLIRGFIGIFLIIGGTQTENPKTRSLLMLIGMWFTIPSLTGSDPIFEEFGLSSKHGDKNHIFNLLKKAKPPSGMKPLLTQNAWPTTKSKSFSFRKTLAQALAIR